MNKLMIVLTVMSGVAFWQPTQSGELCFNSGSQVSGMNRICFYNCVTGTVAITIGAVELCPMSIKT